VGDEKNCWAVYGRDPGGWLDRVLESCPLLEHMVLSVPVSVRLSGGTGVATPRRFASRNDKGGRRFSQ
jgi:hypothetical protein